MPRVRNTTAIKSWEKYDVDPARSKILNEYHLALFRLTGIVTDYVNCNNETFSVCPPSDCNPLCRLIREYPEGCEACNQSTRNNVAISQTKRQSRCYRCHAGMIDVIVPLFSEDKYLGALTTGQVFDAPPTPEMFQEFLKTHRYLKQPEAELRRLYFGVQIYTPEQIAALINLLEIFGNYVVETEDKLKFLESVNEKRQIQAARSFIELHCNSQLSISYIASQVSLSESHFCHLFRQETGTTPIQYLNRTRISRAMELLRNTDKSITEIAMECGFSNLTHFNRMFRKFAAESPRNYRKKQKK